MANPPISRDTRRLDWVTASTMTRESIKIGTSSVNEVTITTVLDSSTRKTRLSRPG